MYYLYILQSIPTNKFYVGSTQNLQERLQRHNQGREKATKSRTPWKLVYHEEFTSREEACRREIQIKRMKSRIYIQNLFA